jgi:hypothetical protein
MIAHISWEGADLIASFAGSISLDLVEAVVDLDHDGEVLGVEILELIDRHPNVNWSDTPSSGSALPSISIDLAAGAIYFRVSVGRSVDQVVCQAALGFDEHGTIHALRVRMGT